MEAGLVSASLFFVLPVFPSPLKVFVIFVIMNFRERFWAEKGPDKKQRKASGRP